MVEKQKQKVRPTYRSWSNIEWKIDLTNKDFLVDLYVHQINNLTILSLTSWKWRYIWWNAREWSWWLCRRVPSQRNVLKKKNPLISAIFGHIRFKWQKRCQTKLETSRSWWWYWLIMALISIYYGPSFTKKGHDLSMWTMVRRSSL